MGQHIELLCNSLPCPEECTCIGATIVCTDFVLQNSFQFIRPLLSLILRNVSLTRMASLKQYHTLLYLDLSGNSLKSLKSTELVFENLTYLNLMSNKVKDARERYFMHLNNLLFLDISSNPIHYIYPWTFEGLISLPVMSIAGTLLRELCNYCLRVPGGVNHIDRR